MSQLNKRRRKKSQKKRDEQERARIAYRKNQRLSQRWKRKAWQKCKPLLEKVPYVVVLHFIKELVNKYLSL